MSGLLPAIIAVAGALALYFFGKRQGREDYTFKHFDNVWESGYEAGWDHSHDWWRWWQERLKQQGRDHLPEPPDDYRELWVECQAAHYPGDCPLCGAK